MTLRSRKDLGQFWTPEPIAAAMVRWVSMDRNWSRFLDPAVGPGVFIRIALDRLGGISQVERRVFAFDLDSSFVEHLLALTAPYGLSFQFRCEDFLLASVPRADAIVCNPPYMKHHFVRNKAQVFAQVEHLTGLVLPRTVSVHALFLLKALATLSPGGRLAFILPSEFLNSDYGVVVKRFLISRHHLRGIASFSSKQLVFSNALTTACVLFADSPLGAPIPRGVLLGQVASASDLELFVDLLHQSDTRSFGQNSGLASDLEASTWWPVESLDPSTKWHHYFARTSRPADGEAIPLHTIGRCSRGIATGANSFFLLTEPEAHKLGFQSDELLRCVGRATDLQGSVFAEADFMELVRRGRPTYLLSLKGRQPSLAARDYITHGETLGLHKRYLTRTRDRWYEVETRDPPDFFVSVFFRQNPKVVLNKARVISLTAFHGFYLEPMFRDAAEPIVRFLNTDRGAAALTDHRREYGGGLMKLEPRDVELALIPRSLLAGEPTTPVSHALSPDTTTPIESSAPAA